MPHAASTVVPEAGAVWLDRDERQERTVKITKIDNGQIYYHASDEPDHILVASFARFVRMYRAPSLGERGSLP